MSEFSFPFTGSSGGDDGPYSASFFAGILEGLFGQDPTTRVDASVIFGTGNGTDDALEVLESSPASTSVEMKQGKALVQGYYYENDADLSLSISANNDGSGFDRIDTVVLEIDFTAQTIRGDVVEGTPSGSPVAPTLTKNTSIYQVPIANVTAQNLFTTILNADIDNTVREQGVLWDTIMGGTGIPGGYVAGDLIVGNGAEDLEILTGGGAYKYPVGKTGLNPPMKFVDIRPTYVYIAQSTGLLATATPVIIDDERDPASLLRAVVSSNKFYPEANIVEILPMSIHVYFVSTATRSNLYFYLYDTVATANVLDVDGNQVRTVSIDAENPGDIRATWLPQVVEFDGTEDIEIRISGTITNTRFQVSASYNKDFVAPIAFRQIG